LPPAAREALGLTWSERVLAWASVDVDPGADTGPEADTGLGSAGGVAAVWAATPTGLRAGGAEELPWDAIAEMSWEPPQLRVRPLRGEAMVVRLRAGSDLAAPKPGCKEAERTLGRVRVGALARPARHAPPWPSPVEPAGGASGATSAGRRHRVVRGCPAAAGLPR